MNKTKERRMKMEMAKLTLVKLSTRVVTVVVAAIVVVVVAVCKFCKLYERSKQSCQVPGE